MPNKTEVLLIASGKRGACDVSDMPVRASGCQHDSLWTYLLLSLYPPLLARCWKVLGQVSYLL